MISLLGAAGVSRTLTNDSNSIKNTVRYDSLNHQSFMSRDLFIHRSNSDLEWNVHVSSEEEEEHRGGSSDEHSNNSSKRPDSNRTEHHIYTNCKTLTNPLQLYLSSQNTCKKFQSMSGVNLLEQGAASSAGPMNKRTSSRNIDESLSQMQLLTMKKTFMSDMNLKDERGSQQNSGLCGSMYKVVCSNPGTPLMQ